MDDRSLDEKISQHEAEITELENEALDPDVLKDFGKLKFLTKKISNLREKLNTYKELKKIQHQLQDTKELLDQENDPELLQVAQEDIETLEKKESEALNLVQELESGRDTKDIRDCILEIRAGTGGEESNIFAADLFRMYAKYAETKGWRVQILSKHQTGSGGFKEIIAQITGDKAYDHLQYESGVHRVQRIPVTESSGRIHTSAASVVVFPLKEESEIEIDPNDLKIDVYRSSGPGGQSVNRTDSAVRMTHIPTGIVVSCQDEKSQLKNKKKALSILASRLEDQHDQEQQNELSEIRKSAIKTGDRSAKIRTYNFPQSRITDHRIRKSWYNLKSIIDGDLDQIIESLREKL
ncbi:MAG: peptide chain release factor 1 [Candidatus Dojkabacteria bacterium]|nr:peptide chain release factor 1 [Candidatus Dojkabacteria bacterium]